MARRKVFIIGNADLLVPQEASPEAANALLKLLEEPPADTTIVATTSEPDGLLPTVRSRLYPMRVAPLRDEEVVSFLVDVRGVPPERAAIAGRLAGGSIGRALGFVAVDGEIGPLEEIRQRAREILDAATAGAAGRIHEVALGQAPAGARGDFSTILESLMIWLRDLAAVDAGADDLVVNADAIEWLRATAARIAEPSRLVPHAVDRVNETLRLTQFNINPQLALSALVRGLGRILINGLGRSSRGAGRPGSARPLERR